MKLFHGGYWYTPFDNRRYENGRISYFDFCSFNEFNNIYFEEIAMELGYQFPFDFLFKPKGKHLNMRFRVIEENEVNMMLDDLRVIRNYRETNIDLVLPNLVYIVEWRLDKEALRHVPQLSSSRLDKCILEELSSDTYLVEDVVINPADHHDPNEKFFNKFV